MHFRRQIKKGQFATDEPEYHMLEQWIAAGDTVLDIGANVGHYTNRLSEIVGKSGRVIALEPTPQTFEILAANSAYFPFKNVTLLNVAASEATAMAGISIPKLSATGLDNYYMAQLENAGSEINTLCVSVDALNLPLPVKLVKIDVEGHELQALKGMEQLLKSYHPVLIVEGDSEDVSGFLNDLGYAAEYVQNSPNRIFTYSRSG